MKKFLLVLFAVLFTAMNTWATDWYVGPTGTDAPSYGTSPATPFLTITYAINQASPNDVIYVAAGIYAERLNIGKSIDLRGAQYGIDPTVMDARTNAAAESTIDVTGLSVPNPDITVEIPVGISFVNISGFTIKGTTNVGNADKSVIRCWGNDATIEDNIIDGYLGILLKGNNNLSILGNRITASKNGVVSNQGTYFNLFISGNFITPGAALVSDPGGIQISNTTGVNDLDNLSNSISNNTITGWNYSAGGRSLGGSNLVSLNITGNTFTGSNDGISIFGTSTFISMSGNTITGNARFGISIKGDDLEIANNVITGNGNTGVVVNKDVLLTERVTILNNDVSGNTTFNLDVKSTVTGPVTATCNWWGTTVPATIAAKVSGTVNWSPFLTTNDLVTPVCDGYAPVMNVTRNLPYLTIQSAIDATSTLSGDVISIGAGTFAENVTVNKRLTLDGAGSGVGGTIIDPVSGAGMSIAASGSSLSNRLIIKDLKVTGALSNGINITAANASYITFDNVACVSNTGHGINTNPPTGSPNLTDIIMNNCDLSNNTSVGFRVATYVGINGLTITGGHMDGNDQGLVIYTIVGSSLVTNVDISGTTFNDNALKGIYVENFDNAELTGITVNHSGFSTTNSAGVDINLKYHNFNNFTLTNSTITNCGTGDATNGVGVTVKARSDGSDYGSHPATLANVSITECNITSCQEGIRFGEPGKNAPGPTVVNVEHCTISGNTLKGIRNETQIMTDATGNYWGTINAAAVAASVSGNVDYDPWCNADFSVCGYSGTPSPFFNEDQGTYFATLQDAINGANDGEEVKVLAGGTYACADIVNSESITLTVTNTSGQQVLITGCSIALTVSSGDYTYDGFTFSTADDNETILVSGGKLTLRNCTIIESTGYIQTGINVTGTGQLDLGTADDPGHNTFVTSGAGAKALTSTSSGAITAMKNYWGSILETTVNSKISGVAEAYYTPWCDMYFSRCSDDGGPYTYASKLIRAENTRIYVPIRVTNESTINSVSLRVTYDAGILSFVPQPDPPADPISIMGPDVPSGSTVIASPVAGLVTVSYTAGEDFILDANDTVVLLAFDYTTGKAPINFQELDPSSIDLEYSHGSAQVPYYDFQTSIYYLPGYVTNGTIAFTREYPGYPTGNTEELVYALATGGTGTYTNYSWTGPGGFTYSSATNVLSLPLGTYGDYTVVVTDNDGASIVGTYHYDRVHNIATFLDYHLFQAGISASSTANGNTLVADAGLYLESNISVNKELTIIGQSKTGVIVAPAVPDVNDDASFGTGYQYAFLIRSSKITIKNLTIDGQGNPTYPTGYNYRGGVMTDHNLGIYLNNITVQDLIIQHTYRRGIQLFSNMSARSTGHVISGNTVDDVMLGPGIAVFDGDHTINGNTVTNVPNSTGIEIVQWSAPGPINSIIQGNTCTNVFTGIQTVNTSSTSIIGGPTLPERNTIQTNGAIINGDCAVGIILRDADDGGTVQNNVISGTGTDAGIWLYNEGSTGSPVIITDNTITATSSSSLLTGYATGIFMSNDGAYFETGDGSPGANVPVYALINNNTITDFQTGLDLYANGPNAVNATINASKITGGTTGLLVSGTGASVTGTPTVTFTGQTGNYIKLVQCANNINGTAILFDGLTGATADLAQNFGIEDMIIHKIDIVTLGFVRVKAGEVFVTPISFSSPTTTTPSVQRGVEAATALDILNVEGSSNPYIENIIVNKSLDIRGPNYGLSPNALIPERISPEAILTTAVANGNIIRMTAGGISIDGFTIDGDSPSVTGGHSFNGADINASIGVYYSEAVMLDHFTIDHNILKNMEVYGVRLQNSSSTGTYASSFNYIRDNIFSNIYFAGAYLYPEVEASIESNTFNGVANGILEYTVGRAASTGFTPGILNNKINIAPGYVYNPSGIDINHRHTSAVAHQVTGNEITVSPSYTGQVEGIRITSIVLGTSTLTATGNTITGNGVCTNGYYLWNTDLSGGVTINGGSITGVIGNGIMITNYNADYGYSYGNGNYVTVDNVSVSTTPSGNGMYAYWPGQSANPGNIYMTVQNDCHITGGAAGVIANGTNAWVNVYENDATITGNLTGIVVVNSATAAINGNTITASTEDGLYVDTGGKLTSCANNFITNNGRYGIFIGSAAGSICSIENNDLSGNAVYAINSGITGPVNATCNWYGTIVPAAIALKINGPVNYSPFLVDGTDYPTPPLPGFQPVPGSCSGFLTEFYVNDLVLTGDVYTTAVGSDANSGTPAAPLRTINHAISLASSTNTIFVDAGEFVENVVVDETLDIRGSNYDISPNGPSRVAESVIKPAVSDPGTTGLNGTDIVFLAADNISFNGFTLDGYNPLLPVNGYGTTGVSLHARNGFENDYSRVGLNISKNIIRNVAYTAVCLDNDAPLAIATNDIVDDNLMQDLGSYSGTPGSYLYGYGIGVLLGYNNYAKVTNNEMTNVRTGIQTSVLSTANLGTADFQLVDNNTMQVRSRGIFYNYLQSTASGLTFSNNTITGISSDAEADFTYGGSSGTWRGILISNHSAGPGTFTNNNIVGSAVTLMPSEGINVWQVKNTSAPVITGGTITDVGTGIYVNNWEGYKSDATFGAYASVSGVNIFPAITGIGILVKDSPSSTTHAPVQVTINGNLLYGGLEGIKFEKTATGVVGGNVSGNTFTNNLAIGIDVTGCVVTPTNPLAITNNTFTLNGQVNSGVPTVCINLSNITGTDDATISGNNISGPLPGFASAFYGYTVYNLNTTPVTTITGGTISGVMQGVAAFNINALAVLAPSAFNINGTSMSGFFGDHAYDPALAGANFHAGVYAYTNELSTDPALHGITIGINNVTVDGTGKIAQDCAGMSFADFSGIAGMQDITVTACRLLNNKNRGLNVRAGADVEIQTSSLKNNGFDAFGTGGNDGFGIIGRLGAVINVHNDTIENPASVTGSYPVTAMFVEGGTITAANNYVVNAGSNPYLLANASAITDNFTATCNWWGSNDLSTISPLIGMYVDDYIPWLTNGTDQDLVNVGFQNTSCGGNPTITGTLKYYHPVNPTPMDGVTLKLKNGSGSYIAESTTTGAGVYTFDEDAIDLGNYTIEVTTNTAVPGSFNSTDAAQVNYWGTNNSSIPQVRYLAGDVWGVTDVNPQTTPTDALHIQQQFVYGTGYFDKPTWQYQLASAYVSGNGDENRLILTMPVSVTTANVTGNDIYGLSLGDFNSSYIWGGTKGAKSSVLLTYADPLKADANTETELSLRVVNTCTVGAASLILYYPSNLAEITGVSMNQEVGQLDWSVNGDELRIGWNSAVPMTFAAGDALLNIRLITSGEFLSGQSIQFTLANDPLNELADGSFSTIPNAELSINTLESSSLGIPGQSGIDQLTLASYPNPFANYTTLKYTLPSDGRVTLEITNMVGMKVATVVNEQQTSGTYSFKLDAVPLQPGMYTATLKLTTFSDNMIKTIKLVRNR